MKRRIVKSCISTLCIHGWYVPLFLLMLGVKICLLSLIADSIKHYHATTSGKYDRANGNENAIIKPQKHKRVPTSTSPPENVVAEIPDNLMDLDISPSAKNRTSSTSIWLIYNSVPQCLEETSVELMETLSVQNRFSHQEHEYQTPWPRFLLEQEQESLVSWFQYQHLPRSYNRHFYYINFTKFQKYAKQKPIYVNIVRDPIDRLVLNYYSRRNMSSPLTKEEIERRNSVAPGSGTEWYHRTFEECVLQADPECRYTAGEKSFTLMIPFFCGQHNSCVAINDRWALQMAKLNIEREYSVVGVLEKMDQTLSVLAKFVPRFFHGAAQVYSKLVKKVEPQHKVSSDVRQVMESELYNEMELYRFILSRLSAQHENG
ncbi:unnamed protein product [Orchesella dallaii]|uniref:Heparan sulfate 2-O-sulfotransferase pipe n=1 Tax=Orchesella dallaii TaxID=48710 RepID=A0ABP1PMK0_9HEXA